MRSLDLPQILYQPFAATGDKNTILDSPSTEDPQRANLQTGFPIITQIPIINGGIPPERKDFNGLGYLLSSFYFFTQCGGIYTFNRNVSNAIGGYPLGAVLYYTDSNGTTYKVRSLLENNTFDFVTTPSYIDDEHWEYVSSTPITQDTSASSASNVFSTAAVQSLLNTVVHKTGDETISGVKTLTYQFVRKMEDLDVTTAPLSNKYIDWISPVDKNGTGVGFFGTSYFTDETLSSRLGVTRYVNGQPIYAEVSVSIKKDGTESTYAPASDAIDSIVTTISKSKSANGYFKLGNGLIIQWGRSSQRTITYPTPFSSDTSFSIVVNNQAGTDGYGRPDSVENLTRTSCMVGSLSGYPVRWIAIGY